MENPPPQIPKPQAFAPVSSAPKKGLGTGAKIGIGCGAVVGLVILGLVIVTVLFGGRVKKFAEEAQKDPTRAAANLMVTASAGKMEIVAEDEANKRYTVKETKSGKLTTIYWSAKKQAPEMVEGDFSAIPTEPASELVPAPAPDGK